MSGQELTLEIQPIGIVRSPLTRREDAPRQGDEGAPTAELLLDPRWTQALADIEVGTRLTILTWLHQADREAVTVHPRDDLDRPLTGVFATRSKDRPNPIGIHEVVVRAVEGTTLVVEPLEAVDGTPVVDIKAHLGPTETR